MVLVLCRRARPRHRRLGTQPERSAYFSRALKSPSGRSTRLCFNATGLFPDLKNALPFDREGGKDCGQKLTDLFCSALSEGLPNS
jgi:hypothetical protein